MYTYTYMANKTFYITPDNEEHLRKESNKSGLVNDLLREHYEGPLNTQVKKIHKIVTGSTPEGPNGFFKLGQDPLNLKKNTSLPNGKTPEAVDLKKADMTGEFDVAVEAGKSMPKCCTLKKPCQHWQFDIDKWVNTITGETREVDL